MPLTNSTFEIFARSLVFCIPVMVSVTFFTAIWVPRLIRIFPALSLSVTTPSLSNRKWIPASTGILISLPLSSITLTVALCIRLSPAVLIRIPSVCTATSEPEPRSNSRDTGLVLEISPPFFGASTTAPSPLSTSPMFPDTIFVSASWSTSITDAGTKVSGLAEVSLFSW